MKRLMLIVMFLLVSTLTAQSNDETACFDKGGVWEDNECLIRSSFELEIRYPLELIEYEIVAETIDAFVIEQKEIFLQYVNVPSAEMLPMSYAPWTLTMNYETTSHSDDILSIIYTISEYTGGAHPNSYYRTFTFNLAENTVITLEDLFVEGANPLEAIAPLVVADLTEQMGEFADAAWIESGTGENMENYRNFALTEDALIFYFPPYQVAAYAAGAFEVQIPLSELSDILAQM